MSATVQATDAWLAERGVLERMPAGQADTYAHVFSTAFGGLKAVRSPYKGRHPRVSVTRKSLAEYLTRRANA